MLEQLPSDLSSFGNTGLLAYVAWHAVKFLATLTKFLERVEGHLEAQKDHRKDEAAAWGRVAAHLQSEEAHQARIERLLDRGTVPNPAPNGGTARDVPVRPIPQIAVESG